MDATTNALLLGSESALSLPAFDRIRAEHVQPAVERAMQLHRAEIAALVAQTEAADFANTVAAFDRCGRLLSQVSAVFHALTASATSPALQSVQRELSAPLSAHHSAVYQDAGLFQRMDEVYQQRAALGLSAEQLRLVERCHRDFVRSGAQLPAAERAEFAALQSQLAQLYTRFSQNLLHDENAYTLALPDEAAMAGLPEFVRAAARQAAVDRGLATPVITLGRSLILPFLSFSQRRDLREAAWRAWTGRGEQPGEHDNRPVAQQILALRQRQAAADRGLATPVITLGRSLILPFLSFSQRRDLREAAWRAWTGRGEQAGEHDNRPVAQQILALRQRQAALMGCANYADFKLVDTMAQTRQRVWALLDEVWHRAVPAMARERELLCEAMAAAGVAEPLEPWDWRFWAEQVRQVRFALDETQLKPYFALPNIVAAAFECAQRLFGLQFVRREDLAAYHPDVAVYQVNDADGQALGLFLQDNFARPAKRSGAWMSSLAVQHRNAADGQPSLPIVMNNNNFAKGEAGTPTLLSPDDVRTLFHEFGHGLHGLLSDVGYERLSGTRVLRDFVELPSQLFEHWGEERDVLQRHARHWQTGEALPEALLDRLQAARRFGQGYETLRYTASAIVDLAAHESTEPVNDIVAFEQQLMAARGLPPEVGMNHRLPHFQHLFAGEGYPAGYYVYLWAEVLEADAWEAFGEAGGAFDPEVAARLKAQIYSRGDSVEPGAAYRAFRGRDAGIEPMLRGRGLLD